MTWFTLYSSLFTCPHFDLDSRNGTDPRNRLPDLVVGGGGTRSDPDDPGVSQPIGSDCLRFRADRLMPNRSGGHVDGVGIFDVVGGNAMLVNQCRKMACVAGIVSADNDHHVQRLLQQRQHRVLAFLGGRADRVERPEVLGKRLGAVTTHHAPANLFGNRQRLSGQHRRLIGNPDACQVQIEIEPG